MLPIDNILTIKKNLPKLLLLGGRADARLLLEKLLRTEKFQIIYSQKNSFTDNKFINPYCRYMIGGFSQYVKHTPIDQSDNYYQMAVSIQTTKSKPTINQIYYSIKGLSEFCITEKIHAIIMMTHPFARQMILTAKLVADFLQLPLFYIPRPLWRLDQLKNSKHSAITIIQQSELNNWLNQHFLTLFCNEKNSKGKILLTLGFFGGAKLLQQLGSWFLQESTSKKISLRPIIWRGMTAPTIAKDFLKTAELQFLPVTYHQMPPNNFLTEKKFLQQHQIALLIAKNGGAEISLQKIHAANHLTLPVIVINPETMLLTNMTNLNNNNFSNNFFWGNANKAYKKILELFP